jgi:hypothetical protein
MLFVPSVRIRPILLLFFWSSRSLSKMQRNDKYQGVVRLLICKNLSPCSFFKVSMMLDKVLVPNSKGTLLLYLLFSLAKDSDYDIEPSLIQYHHKQNGPVTVRISNVTTKTINIPPKAIICELQPVSVQAMLNDICMSYIII